MKCILFSAIIAWVAVASFAYPFSKYPIDWSDVPAATPAPRDLSSPFLGVCVCDTVWGACNPNCCCDTDCSPETKKMFEYCLLEQFGYPDISYCYSKTAATEVKRINYAGVVIDHHDHVSNAVCIIRTNRPDDLYRYFVVPQSVPNTAYEKSIGLPMATKNYSYIVGDGIPLIKYADVDGGFGYRDVGFFQIPIQNSQGSCSSVGQSVPFLTADMGVSCALNGREICSGFPLSKFTNLFFPQPGVFSSDGLTPIIVTLYNESMSGSAPSLDPDDLQNTFEANGVCYNAVTKMTAHLIYSTTQAARIESAHFFLTVKNVESDSFEPLVFESYFRNNTQEVLNNLVSGNVGYMAGHRLRAGSIEKDGGKSAILESRSGFSLPSGGRSCQLNNFRKVGFMDSVINSGCFFTLSEMELKDICAHGSETLVQSVLGAFGSSPSIDYVAKTSDALTNDTSSWIPIEFPNLTPTPGSYDSVSRTCSDILIGIMFKFVIARAGVTYNPQDIVVGAFASAVRGTWKVSNTSSFRSEATSRQAVRFFVNFERYKSSSQETRGRNIVPPRVLPARDEDTFYPF